MGKWLMITIMAETDEPLCDQPVKVDVRGAAPSVPTVVAAVGGGRGMVKGLEGMLSSWL